MTKKISSLLLVTAFIACFMVGCTEKPKDLLSQKWQFKELDAKELATMMEKGVESQMAGVPDSAKEEAKKQAMEGMKKMMDGMMEGMKKDLKMEFKADGTYEAASPNMGGEGSAPKIEKGKWELSEDGKKLTTTDEAGKKEEMDVATLTKTQMVLGSTRGGETMHMVFEPAK